MNDFAEQRAIGDLISKRENVERLLTRAGLTLPCLGSRGGHLVDSFRDRLPFFEDGRGLLNGTAGSLALSDLFRPANDTICATGKLLDALSVRLLGGNGVSDQLASLLACLRTLLFFQNHLMFSSFGRTAAGLGFLTCVFTLEPNTYGGL